MTAPSYDQLKSDATAYYLSNGGNQANVNAYFADPANQGGDYNKLASNAASWYTDQTRPDANTDWNVPAVVGAHQPTAQDYGDVRNQNVAGYFGIAAPPAGQNYNFAPPATPANGPVGTYYPPGTQTPLGTAPGPATAPPPTPVKTTYPNGPVDPNGRYPDPVNPPGTPTSPAPTNQESVVPTYQLGNYNNAPGGRGSLANAQADPGDYWRAHQNDAWAAGANQGEWAAGSGVAGKDPWMDPMHQYMNGSRVYQPGYGMGANGETMHWQGDKPPTGLGTDLQGNPVTTGGAMDLTGLPQSGWLQSQFGIKQPDWKNATDVVRFRRQLQYYWPDIIQRDPTLAKYDSAGKVKNPAFLDSEESGTF